MPSTQYWPGTNHGRSAGGWSGWTRKSVSASVTSMRSTSVALYSSGLAIGGDASTLCLLGSRARCCAAACVAGDDERRVAGGLPFEHRAPRGDLPHPVAGRRIDRDDGAVADDSARSRPRSGCGCARGRGEGCSPSSTGRPLDSSVCRSSTVPLIAYASSPRARAVSRRTPSLTPVLAGCEFDARGRRATSAAPMRRRPSRARRDRSRSAASARRPGSGRRGTRRRRAAAAASRERLPCTGWRTRCSATMHARTIVPRSADHTRTRSRTRSTTNAPPVTPTTTMLTALEVGGLGGPCCSRSA